MTAEILERSALAHRLLARAADLGRDAEGGTGRWLVRERRDHRFAVRRLRELARSHGLPAPAAGEAATYVPSRGTGVPGFEEAGSVHPDEVFGTLQTLGAGEDPVDPTRLLEEMGPAHRNLAALSGAWASRLRGLRERLEASLREVEEDDGDEDALRRAHVERLNSVTAAYRLLENLLPVTGQHLAIVRALRAEAR